MEYIDPCYLHVSEIISLLYSLFCIQTLFFFKLYLILHVNVYKNDYRAIPGIIFDFS